MSVEPGEEFISDDELKSLLERWGAPGPSRVLDERIETSFKKEFSGAAGLPESVLLPHSREEVVSMKFCSKCEEQFADKFSFCPVDGTPLSSVTEQIEEPSLTVSRQESTPAVDTITAFPAKAERDETVHEPAVPVARAAAAAGSSALALREEYHLTIMSDEGLLSRLTHEVRDVAHEYELTWPEFKRDPFGFTKRTFVGYSQMLRKFLSNRNVVLAMG
ncbi:MAG TPA: hypothetical protein VFH91_07020, partial [Pyrinomonadaceae bacterium]|nr:hypothetical protein [Pyrinomonadaceae bacterium]